MAHQQMFGVAIFSKLSEYFKPKDNRHHNQYFNTS
ncbi:hypothetical protein PT041_08875 [Erysipelothrix rhusiopathiae]|nr:hypothetical protein [Erysipelothrix rhusiopathiae]